MSTEPLRVEVVYASSARQARYELRLEQGATVADAIRLSGVCLAFPEIDLARNRIGIHGALSSATRPLRDGDRVEIYRPLGADPKEARRRRAATRKAR
ncbi:MAG: RnfH family protein [Gammaproteobacteria bacterium]|nr:RnfH family protein [Gammaproteobacteria bacterium]